MKQKQATKPLRRSESFLGIHFDLHARDDCTEMGRNVSAKMVEDIITAVHPDYIQCDCKGHPGLSSYPTEVGYQAPGFVRDPLKIWRQVTMKHGVALFMHYSGVFDAKAVTANPTWARVDEKGHRDKRITSTFGPYVDKLLIPQMKELAGKYHVDGVWVDGECWAVNPDYGKKVLRKFHEATGINEVSRKPEDPYYFEFLEFCRQSFRDYLAHYVDEVHKAFPDFQIASNWAYSSHMLEVPNSNVDFISGDYAPCDSLNSARFEGRILAPQGKPWDLMAWSFSSKGIPGVGTSNKSVVQLQQEAAAVLALGGGFQAYFKQNRDGSINPWTMDIMAETAKFCRERQSICHRAKALPQVALLASSKNFYRNIQRCFADYNESVLPPIKGSLFALLDSQYSVEILLEDHLEGRMNDYPLIVVPEAKYLEADFILKLKDYVANGGNLLVFGTATVDLFEKYLGVKLGDEIPRATRFLDFENTMMAINSDYRNFKPLKGTEVFGSLHERNNFASKSLPAASIASLGKGKIAAVYFNPGTCYFKERNFRLRNWLGSLVARLFPAPMVEVKGSHHVDVCVNEINGKIAINLLNTSGPHSDAKVSVFDELQPVGPLDIEIRVKGKVESVKEEPSGRELPFKKVKGGIELTLPELKIHGVIVLE
jgi:hypothetical protein